jgi:hypothetical protein
MPRPKISTASRTEWIADINLPTNNVAVQLPTNGGQIPNDRYIHTLWLQFEGRITNAASNNPTGTQADGVAQLLDTIQVSGYHRLRGASEQFINVRGHDAYELAGIYGSRFPTLTPVNLALGVSATNDIRFFTPIYFTPMGVSLEQMVDFLLDAPNYDALKLNINYGDDQSVFTYGTRGAPTFSAFGSGSGNPRIRVLADFAQAGRSQFANFVPARAWRYFIEDTSAAETTTTANARLINIPRGYRMRSILLKTGAKSTAVASGNTSYNTLIDSMLANLKVFRGTNKVVKFFADQRSAREIGATYFSVTPDLGYQLLEFAPRGSWHESLDCTGLAAGPTGDTDVFIGADTTGAANQATLALFEELRGLPLAG